MQNIVLKNQYTSRIEPLSDIQVCHDYCRSKDYIHDRHIVDDTEYYGIHLSDIDCLNNLCPHSKYWDYIEFMNAKHISKHPLPRKKYCVVLPQKDYYFPTLFKHSRYLRLCARLLPTPLWKRLVSWSLYAYLLWCLFWGIYLLF